MYLPKGKESWFQPPYVCRCAVSHMFEMSLHMDQESWGWCKMGQEKNFKPVTEVEVLV